MTGRETAGELFFGRSFNDALYQRQLAQAQRPAHANKPAGRYCICEAYPWRHGVTVGRCLGERPVREFVR